MLRIPHSLDNRLTDSGKVVKDENQYRYTGQPVKNTGRFLRKFAYLDNGVLPVVFTKWFHI
jgi:hypothetical protein